MPLKQSLVCKRFPGNGFTLIELSIVLVIIGLMVGAIVGGRALVHQARLSKMISEFGNYRVALNNFYLQYDFLPGDFPQAWQYFGATCGNNATGGNENSCNGNGDGYITSEGVVSAAPGFEDVIVARHLYLAGLIEQEFSNATSGGQAFVLSDCGQYGHDNCPRHTIPESNAIDRAGWWIVTIPENQHASDNTFFGRTGTAIIFGRQSLGASAANDGWALSGPDSAAIDKKLDDGIPSRGKVLAAESHNYAGCVTPALKYGDATTGTNRAYNLTSASGGCFLVFMLE